jgi:hydroxylation protein CepL
LRGGEQDALATALDGPLVEAGTRTCRVDLGDPGLYASERRSELWRRLRAEAPVAWVLPGRSHGGFWSVATHAGCEQVLHQSQSFTSRYGMFIGFDAQHPDPASDRMLVTSDGERHARLRTLLQPFFALREARRIEGEVKARMATGLAELLRDEVDVVEAFASQIPVFVVCSLLGVPPEDWELLAEFTRRAFGPLDPTLHHEHAALDAEEAQAEILLYFEELALRRTVEPAADAVSALVGSQARRLGLTLEDAVATCDNVLIGGNETTRHAIAGTFVALARHGDAWRRMRENGGLAASAVEELLRWTSPAMHVLRVAVRDTTVAGVKIHKGEAVVTWLPSANRDAAVFGQPEIFQPERRPNPHLAFGGGPHFCLGAALARMELRALVGGLRDLVAEIELARDPTILSSNRAHGYTRVPVRMTGRGDGR